MDNLEALTKLANLLPVEIRGWAAGVAAELHRQDHELDEAAARIKVLEELVFSTKSYS